MIVVKMIGGLGNQMFQYGLAKSLSLKYGTKIFIDLEFFDQDFDSTGLTKRKFELDCFKFKKRYLSSWKLYIFKLLCEKRVLNFVKIEDKNINFNKLKSRIFNLYLNGYFQNYSYFKDFEEKLRKDFEFKKKPNKKNIKILKDIARNNSVSIHFRRTDYVTNKITNKHHGVCNLDYYQKTVKLIGEKVKDPIFYIFSDDINWVKVNFKIKYKTYYIDHNKKGWQDLRLMSQCKHNIIANSSFSWWGAWLNENREKIVIAPKKWFAGYKFNKTDRIMKDWIIL